MLRSTLLTFLFFITSCALFKGERPMDGDVEKLLASVRMTGEGRGRLGVDEGKYLFGFDAILKDQVDWILAVSVPLHGEEVMVLRDIKESEFDGTAESFEVRLQREIDARVKDRGPSGADFVRGLRALVRFVLAPTLSLERKCEKRIMNEDTYLCIVGQDTFLVGHVKDKFFIRKDLGNGFYTELLSENLTESFFARSSFILSSEEYTGVRLPQVSLELFWK